MSFKRVGDDYTAIQVQKKQRVSELLLQDIPEDEATLLRNGRFACLVCKHCPVFDTVAVLSIHRQGKKHLANAKIRLERLKEDAELRQKREHMKYLTTLGYMANGKDTPLLTYTQEKKKLALQGSAGMLTNTDVEREKGTNNQPFFQSRKPINWNTEDGIAKIINSNSTPEKADSSNILPNAKNDLSENKVSISNTNSQMKDSVKTESRSQLQLQNSNMSSSGRKHNVISTSELARREHNSRLLQAGWKMDLNGKWYKDENVEFDSDEEEPPPPP